MTWAAVAEWVAVAAGGAVGAPCRWFIDGWVAERLGPGLPWGTLVVNSVGSLILGALVGWAATAPVPVTLLRLVGTGFCGSLTTFSTFTWETVRLAAESRHRAAAANVVATLTLPLSALVAGFALAS